MLFIVIVMSYYRNGMFNNDECRPARIIITLEEL
jgi:hypothetical protein